MKKMRFKSILLIFFIGLITGITINPLAIGTPKKAFLSPVTVSLAETREITLPTSEGEVLGVAIKVVPTPEPTKPEDVVHFGGLLTQQIVDNEEKPEDKAREVEKVEKMEIFGQSNYSGRVTIAALGDSMTDLMGPDLPYLKKELLKYYPKADFNLLNYGVGAENIEKGLERMGREYTYQDRHYSALISIDPDIVIVESFAYNPFDNEEKYLDKHWSILTQIVDRLKGQTKAKIMIMSTIAPAKANFGEGPAGINWPKDLAWQHANRINEYLENTTRFAQSAGLPLIDVYHKTLLSNGEGNPAYINPGDHIHQNVAGNEFISSLIARKIFELGLIK